MVGTDLAANRDFQGHKIYGKGGIGLERYLMEIAFPYAVTGLLKDIERGQVGLRKALPFVGILPANRRAGLSDAEKVITEYQDEQRARVTPAPTAHTSARNRVYQTALKDPKAANRLGAEEIRKGNLTALDVKHSIQRAKQGPFVSDVKRIGKIGVVLDVYDKATPEERKKIQKVVHDKVQKARGDPTKWDADSRALAAKYFHVHPHIGQGELGAPAAIQ
jgi:hypothetical protein